MSLAYGDEVTIRTPSNTLMTGTYVERYRTTIDYERVTRYRIVNRRGREFHGPFYSSTQRTPAERATALDRARNHVSLDFVPWLGPAVKGVPWS